MRLSNSGQLLLVVMVWLFSLQGFWRRSLVKGCWEEERNALLQLKAYFNYPNGTSFSSWGDNHADCCGWERVECSIGRVYYLDLSWVRVNYSHFSWARANDIETREEWFLNASMFIPFKGLNYLLLDGNGISGCVENGGFEKFSQLSNIEVLSLSGNELNNSILLSLGSISSLRILRLDYNRLSGTINMKDLDALKHLEELVLDGNYDIKLLVASRGLNKLRELQLLDITTADNRGFRLESVGAFPSLKVLHLSGNYFDGPVFTEGLYNYSTSDSLEILDLTGSTVDDHSLQSLRLLPSLKSLYMVAVNGIVPIQGLPTFKYLETLDLTDSTVNVSFLQTVGTMTALKELYLVRSNLNGTLPAAQGLCNLKNLRVLDFMGARLNGALPACLSNLTRLEILLMDHNNLSGTFPASLANLTTLQALDLSHNLLLRGEFLYWLLETNRALNYLHLQNCSFSGPLQLPKQPHLNLTVFNISYNTFHGHIPEEVGIIFPSLSLFAMSNNAFIGRLPSSFGNMTLLAELDLSNNSLSGEIPRSLSLDCFSLISLKLANNNLEGQIFSSGVNLTYLGLLRLDGNQFTGTIPDGLSNLSSTLAYIDLSRNRITGRIPVGMGNMSFLQFLDLSHNGISGSLPSGFSPFYLEFVSLSNNKLDGSLAGAFYGCSNLVALDLGHNYFTGTIPAGIESLSQLSYLILRANNLEGDIPLQLCELKKLTFIDLFHNNLSGRLLPCLRCKSNQGFREIITLELSTKKTFYLYSGWILTYMAGINLSFNNLTGEIPPEIGNLTDLKVLNLSYNGLTGQIPTTFSNLKQVESLDLSHNSLGGNIPPQLTELNYLEVFYVAYNNLTGKIPDSKQFATFENRSYEGNPFLCGPPLTRTCFSPESPPPFPKIPTDNDEESGFMDMVAFKVSFLVAYFMVVLAIASVLYINPQWRRGWFYFIGVIINNSYYFLVDNLPVPSRFRYWQPCI